MSDKITEKQTLEKLSNMREFISKLCKEYNEEARKIDMNGRLAVMSAYVYDDDNEYSEDNKDKEDSTKTWQEKVESWDCEASVSIDRCNAGGWFPSAICR